MRNQRYFDLESIPQRVLVALEQLGRIERAIYVLHNLLRHSPRDIALVLNMTEQAVQAALQRSAARVAGAPVAHHGHGQA